MGSPGDVAALKRLVILLKAVGDRALLVNDASTVLRVLEAMRDIARLCLLHDTRFLLVAERAAFEFRRIAATAIGSHAYHGKPIGDLLPTMAEQVTEDEQRELKRLLKQFEHCDQAQDSLCALDPNEMADEMRRHFNPIRRACTCATSGTPACAQSLKAPAAEDQAWTFWLKTPRQRQLWLSRNYARLALQHLAFNSPRVRLARCRLLGEEKGGRHGP